MTSGSDWDRRRARPRSHIRVGRRGCRRRGRCRCIHQERLAERNVGCRYATLWVVPDRIVAGSSGRLETSYGAPWPPPVKFHFHGAVRRFGTVGAETGRLEQSGNQTTRRSLTSPIPEQHCDAFVSKEELIPGTARDPLHLCRGLAVIRLEYQG